MTIVKVPKCKNLVSPIDGIRVSTEEAQMAKLKAAFIKPHGTLTASSYLMEAPSPTIIMTKVKAKEFYNDDSSAGQ